MTTEVTNSKETENRCKTSIQQKTKRGMVSQLEGDGTSRTKRKWSMSGALVVAVWWQTKAVDISVG